MEQYDEEKKNSRNRMLKENQSTAFTFFLCSISLCSVSMLFLLDAKQPKMNKGNVMEGSFNYVAQKKK